jgi:hypothetical protein
LQVIDEICSAIADSDLSPAFKHIGHVIGFLQSCRSIPIFETATHFFVQYFAFRKRLFMHLPHTLQHLASLLNLSSMLSVTASDPH